MTASSSAPGRDLPDSLSGVAREFARHASPRLLVAIVGLALAARLALGGWSWWDLAIAAGIVAFWPLQEWLIHVLILHYRPRSIGGRVIDFRVPQMHRAHHRDPWRTDLVFIPTHVFWWAPIVVGAGWLVLAPEPAQAFTAIFVYFALSLHYEWVHLLVHTRYRPRTRLYRRLWRNHRLHHFKNEHYWYGVTMLGGDRVLGTAADPDSTETSPTARTLGLEDSLGAG